MAHLTKTIHKANHIKTLLQTEQVLPIAEQPEKYPKIELAAQLKLPDLRFILLGKSGEDRKRPRRKGWQTKNNHAYDDRNFLSLLRRGLNYGVVTGINDLVVFDGDEYNRLVELGVVAKLPETFTIQTGSGNRHYYYFCPGLDKRITMYDPVLKDPKNPNEPLHLGEIQSRGQYVVGPGCIHPNGNRYLVIHDVPIARVTLEVMKEAIRGLLLKSKTGETRDLTTNPDQHRRKYHNCPFTTWDVGGPRGRTEIINGRHGKERRGTPPSHSSDGGKSFLANSDGVRWHCFAHESGGGPWELLAVKHGIIECGDARPGCLRGKFHLVKQAAIDDGLIAEDEVIQPPIADIKLIGDDNRLTLDELPTKLPDGNPIVLKAPPRIGKTFYSMTEMINEGSGNYIAPNHAIIESTINAFIRQGRTNGVHIEGRGQPGMCRDDKSHCNSCRLCPNKEHGDHTSENSDHISFPELMNEAKKLLHKHPVLTKKEIPIDLCPYYTLQAAEKFADYCFTVPQLIEEIKIRNMCILDEDTVLKHFYTPTVDMLELDVIKDNHVPTGLHLDKACEQLKKRIKEKIETKIKKRERITKADRVLLRCCILLEGINSTLDETWNENTSVEKIKAKILEQLKPLLDEPYDKETMTKALNKLDDYPTTDEGNTDVKDFIRCLLNLYKKNPVSIQRTGRNGKIHLYLVGDALTPTIDMNKLNTAVEEGKKVLIIGQTTAELFGSFLGGEKARVIDIKKFNYENNFVVISIRGNNDQSAGGQVKTQRRKMIRFLKALMNSADCMKSWPSLILAGSKARQNEVAMMLGGKCHQATDDNKIEMQRNYLRGGATCFYQNSVISRGQDVDWFNVLVVYDCDFAQPFWRAASEVNEVVVISERETSAFEITASILSDETTNSVLRISPIRGRNELRPKIILVPENDLWKIRYLDDQVLNKAGETTASMEDIATLLKDGNLPTTTWLTIDPADPNDMVLHADTHLEGPWEEAVREGRLVEMFQIELDRIGVSEKFSEEELADTMRKILVAMTSGRGKAMKLADIESNMGALRLRHRDDLIEPAMRRLYYDGKIVPNGKGANMKWTLFRKLQETENEKVQVSGDVMMAKTCF